MQSILEQFIDFTEKERISGDAYLVGGTVRDILSGNEIKDMDIALKGDAVETAKKFARNAGGSFVLLDEEFETARVVKNGLWVDISAMRGDSINADLAERDITINAMAIPLTEFGGTTVPGLRTQPPVSPFVKGELKGVGAHGRAPVVESGLSLWAGSLEENIIDPFNGKDDLLKGVIRMVSEENLIKDPLRILRIYRFSAALGFSIEKKTLNAVKKLKSLINSVSVERITEELRHILILEDSYKTIKAISDSGLLLSIFPEVEAHSIKDMLLLYKKSEEILTNLSFYLPEHTKPIAEYFDDDSKKVCLKMSIILSQPDKPKEAVIRLKMSRKEVGYIDAMQSNRHRILDLHKEGKNLDIKKTISLMKKFRNDLYPLLILSIAQAYILSIKNRILPFCQELLSFYQESIIPKINLLPVITGDDLIREFGLKPSPLFKKILARIEDMVLEGRIRTKEEALEHVTSLINSLKLG